MPDALRIAISAIPCHSMSFSVSLNCFILKAIYKIAFRVNSVHTRPLGSQSIAGNICGQTFPPEPPIASQSLLFASQLIYYLINF